MLGMKAFGARPAPKNYADGGAVKRRKASGPVRGPGTGISDEVPDEVPEGTYIMPADSTQAIGEQELAGLGAEQIPVNLSNGEFKLSPEQVHAVGVQALDQMRDATHTPAAQQGAGLGMKPELFFADGGVVDDEEKRRQTALQPSPSSPSSTYPGNRFPAYDGRSTQPQPTQSRADFVADQNAKLATANERLAQQTADLNARRSPAPNSPSNIYPYNRVPDAAPAAPAPAAAPLAPPSEFSAIRDFQASPRGVGMLPQVQVPNDPAAAARARDAVGMQRIAGELGNAEQQKQAGIEAAQRTGQYDAARQQDARRLAAQQDAAQYAPKTFTQDVMDTAAMNAQAAWDKGGAGGVGEAAGHVVRGALGSIPAAFYDVGHDIVAGPIGRGVGGFFSGLAGGGDDAAPAAASPAARKAPPASKQAPGATPQTQSLANAEEMQRRTGKGGELPAPQPEPVQVMPGVYRHGRGQYSDSAKGMGFAEGFTGRPSAQNMAAASNLAAQQQRESMGRVLAQQAQAQQGVMQPRGFNAPQPKHSGNDWEARNNLRSLRMAAERAMEDAPRKRFAAQHPAVIAYQQAQQADMQARGGQLDADLKTQEVNAAMQREQMQQQGASQRDAARLGLDQQRLALDERKSASEIRSADRQEKLYQRYEAAAEKGDAKGMAAVAQQIRELKGSAQEAPWKFQVTPATKNVDGSTSEGNLLRYNPQTGAYEVLPLSGGSSNTGIPTPQSKAEYDALPKGAQYIKDGKTLIKG